MQKYWQTTVLWMDKFLTPIDEPGSRLFHWNIVIAFLIACYWLGSQYGFLNLPSNIKRTVFNKKYWWNSSTKFDYKIYFINSLFKVLIFIPFLDFSFWIARQISKTLFMTFENHEAAPMTPLVLFLFTLGAFVYDDFLRFFHHRLMHKIPCLWRLHSVHHSAKILTPVTLYRTHPLESAMATVRNSLSVGVITGVFVFYFSQTLTLWTVLGVNGFGFLFNLLGANLRHSHLPIGFGKWIESIFISPKQHQIHHSVNLIHRDKNFGVSLAVWDKMGGSWVSSSDPSASKLKFGLGNIHRRPFLKELSLARTKMK